MSGIFNWDDELLECSQKLKDLNSGFDRIRQTNKQESDELMQLRSEIINLASAIGVPVEDILETPSQQPVYQSSKLQWDDDFFLNDNPLMIEAKIKEEVFRSPEILPPLSSLEYGIVGIAGVVASLLDFLIVKIPKDINYLGKYQQQGSEFTAWLKTLGVDENGELNPFLKWCETVCKVPYDRSIDPNIPGFNPRTHRLLSLSHDPLFGLIFGTLDILNGSMTTFDINGNIQIIKTFDLSPKDKVFAPFLWLGHIISDMCTKMGVPIPGWGFLQLLQFGSFGSKNQTIADISRWMYLNGYDLRHFITMSVPVAAIEIIIRGYHYLSSLETSEQIKYSLHGSVASKELTQIKSNLKLHKMLFLAHAIAASGNALKVFVYSGNPLAINLTQWLFFLKETVNIVRASMRDRTPETIIRNRSKIDREWEEIQNINIGRFSLLDTDSTIYFKHFSS
ncbi:MAG: hypothetical protein WBV73_19430 [Phormidium sp.]